MWRFELTRWHRTFRHGWQKSPKNWRSRHCSSHAWCSALNVQRTETFLDNNLPGNFGVQFFLTRLITWELIRHGDLKWLKTEVVLPGSDAQERGTELNATTGQLVKTRALIGCGTTNISDTKKAHATGCWCIWCPHACRGSKINKISEGERSDTIMSVAA